MRGEGLGWVREWGLFLGAVVRGGGAVGAVAPSSGELARVVVEASGLGEGVEVVVELGAGTGVFTRELVRRLPRGAELVVVERDEGLAERLREEFGLDGRVRVVWGCASGLGGYLGGRRACRVVSGLPWAGMGEGMQERLLGAICGWLREGGVFVTFAYWGMHWLPAGRRFRRMLGGRFERVGRTGVVWGNLPPAFVYRCEGVVGRGRG